MQPQVVKGQLGWIEVVTGCMFSGKTEELIRRMRRCMYARQSVVIFKPGIDDRYTSDSVGSHSGMQMRSLQIQKASQIPALVQDAQVVGIDEAQFLGPELVPIVEALANEGRRVIVAGLDQDYLGQPFEPIPHLLAVAEYITKNLAICTVCGNPADRSQRLVEGDGRVLVGAADAYEARCRLHWSPEPRSLQEELPLGRNLAEAESTES
ncbi:MAG: thymidine kinase [Proteobacteria bacterium]|nr:thymidine kinase [Pseudomonadota bacterium]MCP4917747.1 thymidine kinase [Pseudomonadota bacterium]